MTDHLVAHAELLGLEQRFAIRRLGPTLERFMHLDHRHDGVQEPRIDRRLAVNLVDRHAVTKCLRNGEDAKRRCAPQLIVHVVEGERVGIEPLHADVEHAQRLLDRLREGATDRHHLADALHLAADAQVGAAELAEIPARDLAHDVIESRLEERRGAARDRVRDLGQRMTERDPRRDVRERIAGGLAGQRRGAAQPRIDLDHAVVSAVSIQRELDVAFAHDAKMADRLDRDAAKQLVLGVVQRLRRGDHDRFTGVNPHRVEVLHVADGDAVVPPVAHDLVLDLLPASQVLLDQDLGDAAGEGPTDRRVEVGLAVDQAAALPTERKAAA